MRKIQTQDIFVLARIIKKAELKDKLTELFRGGRADNEIGLDFMMLLLDACGDSVVEESFYKLIGGISEMKPEEVKQLPVNELVDVFKKMSDENDLSTFFRMASK